MSTEPTVLRIAVAQLNPIVGDVAGNLAKAREARADAARQGADLVLYTELFISGYPPEDLVLKPAFLAACEKAANEFAADTADGGPGVIIGTPLKRKTGTHNSVVVADGGKIIAERYKVDLPNYGEFDEKRVFDEGSIQGPYNFRGVRIGIPICEEIWNDLGICETLAENGAEILLVPNGSPYYRGKVDVRHQVVLRQVIESGLPILFANQLGGQDELIFDGASFAINADKALACQMSQFEETVAVTTWKKGDGADEGWACTDGPMSKIPEKEEADYSACMLGLRDYVNKNGFKNVVLGLSGGIDSAICAALAVDALGEERVRCVMMPYRYTSKDSLKDAEDCARMLGCRYDIVPIFEPVEGFLHALTQLFEGTKEGITEEIFRAAPRTILMAISNKFGSMVVTTGNKSEMSVGYATLYGDMNGGFNPIKDLYKMQVYALSTWRNGHVPPGALGPTGEVIPKNIIDKAPSAELRENQTDQDLLPPYPVLDDILECLVENEMGIEQIVKRGHARETVTRIEHLLYIAEYKRRQAARVKITKKNFGRDRRYPITNKFRDRGLTAAGRIMEISHDPSRLDFQATSDLLKATYWGNQRTDDINRRAFANSICAIALIDGRQAGFARASGDRVIFARISDVIVWPEHRGKGVGRALVQALLDHPELRSVSAWMLNTSDAHGLYKRFGFQPVTDGNEMRLDR